MESGRMILLRLLHDANTSLNKAVTASGIDMLTRDEQPAKAPGPIQLTESGITILVNPEQLSKAPPSIRVTPSGIVKEVRLVQPSKIQLGISVQESGIRTSFRLVQPENKLYPMSESFSDSGIFALTSSVQP